MSCPQATPRPLGVPGSFLSVGLTEHICGFPEGSLVFLGLVTRTEVTSSFLQVYRFDPESQSSHSNRMLGPEFKQQQCNK